MSGHANAPEQALRSVFLGAIKQLEEVAKTEFSSSMVEKVWDTVSKEKLKSLKESFILEFCDQILGSFEEAEVNAMLEEHKRTSVIRNMKYSTQLQVAFGLSQQNILDAVVEKANSMTTGWIPQIVDAVKKEGIQLPEQN